MVESLLVVLQGFQTRLEVGVWVQDPVCIHDGHNLTL